VRQVYDLRRQHLRREHQRCTARAATTTPRLLPQTLNVVFGTFTGATPDGRRNGEPLTDGISPVQGMDKGGPVATLQSLLTSTTPRSATARCAT
jgi:pyruvate-formate lyase